MIVLNIKILFNKIQKYNNNLFSLIQFEHFKCVAYIIDR